MSIMYMAPGLILTTKKKKKKIVFLSNETPKRNEPKITE